MLRCLAALLVLLFALAGLANAQEQSGTRETPPPGRAVPPVAGDPGTDVAKPQPAQAPDAPTKPAKPETAPATAAQQAAATRRVAKGLGKPGPAPPAHIPALGPGIPAPTDSAAPDTNPAVPRGKFAHAEHPWRKLGAHPEAEAEMHGPTALAANFASRAERGTDQSLLASFDFAGGLAVNAELAAGHGPALSFVGTANGGAPLDLALPSGPPHMSTITLRPGITELTRGNPKQKKVALSFDDGPHPQYTAQLLAILDYYHIHATFFIVGVQAQKYPQWVKMIHQAGHEIGNHTFDHFRLPALPAEEQAYQLDENQRLLAQLTGETPRFFRPPGGRYDATVGKLLHQRGMLLALWDVALNDTAEDREAGDLYSTASKKIRPGSVVLGHDGIQATIDMLPQLIESLKNDGYTFVTMSELAAGM